MSDTLQPHKLAQVDFVKVVSPLLQYQRNVASQTGEDGIIEFVFSILPHQRYCIEFGAWDGFKYSNTWNLLKNAGWGGCLIEGNPQKFAELERNYRDGQAVKCVNRFVDFEGANCLDNILDEAGAPREPDLLSIDVDGTDYFIWESLQRYQPRLVVIEFNPTIPNDVVFVQARNPGVNQGCSLLALILLGKQKGYELVCATGWNAFFVRAEDYSRFGISNNHIMSLYKPVCDGRIFHGYDSYVYTIGMNRLLWSDHVLAPEQFQVLPDLARQFGDAQR